MRLRTRLFCAMPFVLWAVLALPAAPAMAYLTDDEIYCQGACDCISQMPHSFPPSAWYLDYAPNGSPSSDPTVMYNRALAAKNAYGIRVFHCESWASAKNLLQAKGADLDREGIKLIVPVDDCILGALSQQINSSTTSLYLPLFHSHISAPLTLGAAYAGTTPAFLSLVDDANEDLPYDSNSVSLHTYPGNWWDEPNDTYSVTLAHPPTYTHLAGTVVVRWQYLDNILDWLEANGHMGRVAAFYAMDVARAWRQYDPNAWVPVLSAYTCMNVAPVQNGIHDRLDARGITLPVIWKLDFFWDGNGDPVIPFSSFNYSEDYFLNGVRANWNWIREQKLRSRRHFLAANNVNTISCVQLGRGLSNDDFNWLFVDPRDFEVYQQVIAGASSEASWVPAAVAFSTVGNLGDANVAHSVSQVAWNLLGAVPVVNRAPGVSAGPDRLNADCCGITLTGSVNDDGLPAAPATLSYTWSQQDGPGTTTFGNASAAVTTATFSQTGTYVLRLTVSDSALVAYDDCTVVAFVVPTVDAGSDQALDWPTATSVELSGAVSDDGLPAALTHTWSKHSGPGTVTFADANALDTTATFSTPGSYVLRLTASDSATTSYDECSVCLYPWLTAPEYAGIVEYSPQSYVPFGPPWNRWLLGVGDDANGGMVTLYLETDANNTISLSSLDGLTFTTDTANIKEFSGSAQDVNAAINAMRLYAPPAASYLIVKMRDQLHGSSWLETRNVVLFDY
jgi:hypothetical protein